jgi:tRNA pseudouridine55 synthase
MHGIFLVDKPAGITSAEVVRRVKAKVRPARVGHLGTLDPFATGVLPILVGEGTKLAPYLEGGDKEYEGVVKLGVETDTLDPEGQPVREAPVPRLDAGRLSEIAAQFTGKIEQTPPVFSAIKRGGVRMYELARKGIEVTPPPRTVEVKRLSLEPAGADLVRFLALCSAGTYARSLARDISIALGTVGHLIALKRLRNGAFALEDASALEAVLEDLDAGRGHRLVGLREALREMPEVAVDADVACRLCNGDARALDGLVPGGGGLFKVVREGRLLAVAKATSRVTAALARVFGVASGGAKAGTYAR